MSRLVFVWMLLVVFAGTGIAQESIGTPTQVPPTATPVPRPKPIRGAIGPYQYPENVNPLTGLEVDDPSVLQRRPIIVKVSNSPALVRPQAGIGQADLMFEHYTEAGVTRFSAIFYGFAPDRVGSIRSARLIDYELVPMYQGMLAFSGASIGTDKRIYGSGYVVDLYCSYREDFGQCQEEVAIKGPVGEIPPSEFADRAYKGVYYGSPYYWRDSSIPVPHNMFTNPNALWELADEDGVNDTPELTGMTFHPEVPAGAATDANHAQIRYETTVVDWYYDEETGKYYRWTDGEQHFDANTDEPISADNVIIVFAGHYLTDIIESQWQDRINWGAQITVWPEGKVHILRDGKRYDGLWLRPSRGELMSFQTYEGEWLYLKPGNSWFQLVKTHEQWIPEREWVFIEE